MNPALAELKDIHLPEDVSWWPLAPGWWILAGLLTLLIVSLFLFIRYKRANAWRKTALIELDSIINAEADDAFTRHISQLTRRCALVLATKSGNANTIAKLEGIAWADYLSSSMPRDTAEWLAIDRYKSNSRMDKQQIQRDIRAWIKKAK